MQAQVHDDKRSSLDDHSSNDEKEHDRTPPVAQQPFNGVDVGDEAIGPGIVTTAKSRGVMKMELLMGRLNNKWLIALYGGFTLLAYAMSLDQYSAGTYLTVATSQAFKAHSVLSTVNTVRSVFQAVSQPPIARISDVFGRVETHCLCISLYVIGYIIVASSTSIYMYAAGNSIYIVGITGAFLLQNIIISEISSLRNRIFWSIFPSIPGAINVWVSGDITESMLSHASWRWGYGIHTILTPVLALPILITLWLGMRRGKKDTSGLSEDVIQEVVLKTRRRSLKEEAKLAFWQLDFIGLLLLVGGFGLFLVSITLANSKKTTWSSPQSLAMLITGAGITVIFILWERFGAPHPLVPFRLLTSRTVIACLFISLFHPVAMGIAGQYFTTFLLVAGNKSVKAATRIRNIPSFVSLFSALSTGVIVRYTKHIKPVMLAGFVIEILGLALMVRFRQSTNSTGEIIAVQIVRGIGAGMISFPTQAAIQSVSKHEHLASITAFNLLIYYISGGIGSAIGGALWTTQVPGKLASYMPDAAAAASAYADPITFIKKYAVGTAERMAVARAHDETQRLMVTVASCMAGAGFFVSLFLENVKVGDESTLAEVEALDEYGTQRIQPASETSATGNKSWLQKAWRF